MNDDKACVGTQSQCTSISESTAGALNETENLISQLENRLETVLKQNVPQPETASEQKDGNELVPLASAFRQHRNRIRANNEAITSMLERLEN